MAKKSKDGRENVKVRAKSLPEPFSPATCQRMRNIRDKRNAAKTKEADLKANRKYLEEQISQASDGEETKIKDLKSEHYDVEQSLEVTRAQIKWLADEMDATIEKADQGTLFEDDIDPEPPEDLFDHAAAAAQEEAGAAAVAEPEPKKPSRGRKSLPPAADEVPEHLASLPAHLLASVNELDLPDQLKGKLINAGFDRIAQLVSFVDNEKNDLSAELEIGENKAAEIAKALKAYRKKHRSAAAEKDREEAAAATS